MFFSVRNLAFYQILSIHETPRKIVLYRWDPMVPRSYCFRSVNQNHHRFLIGLYVSFCHLICEMRFARWPPLDCFKRKLYRSFNVFFRSTPETQINCCVQSPSVVSSSVKIPFRHHLVNCCLSLDEISHAESWH